MDALQVVIPLAIGTLFMLISLTVAELQSSNAGLPTDPIRPPQMPDQNEKELERIAKSVQGLKEWSLDEWQALSIGYLGSTDPDLKWNHAIVYLELPMDARAPAFCKFGWAAMVTIDLDTKEAISADFPTESNHVCGVEFGGPVR